MGSVRLGVVRLPRKRIMGWRPCWRILVAFIVWWCEVPVGGWSFGLCDILRLRVGDDKSLPDGRGCKVD
jgi:hypothetical protein